MKLTLFVILVLATLVAIVNCWRRFPVYRPQNGELQVVMVLYKIIIYIYFIYILNCCDAVIYIIRWMRIMCIPLPPPLPVPYACLFAVKSGQQVALKMTARNLWLGCDQHWCAIDTCPEWYFSRPKSQCPGNVFVIYSQHAQGKPIKVGDKVGLYYPTEKKWFGCAGHLCGKAPCPGKPTHAHGFENYAKWKQCWGEVFTIYAYGKKHGESIYPKDAIMLYMNHHRQYASLWRGKADKNLCPGPAPPPKSKYDHCRGEVFEIFVI